MAKQFTKLWHLENLTLFKEMGEKDLEEIEKMTIMRTIKKDDYIYFPEDPSSTVFFLKQGRIKICNYSEDGKEIIKSIIYPGEIFGEMGLVEEESRQDFSQAMDDNVLICAMNKENMHGLMGKKPNLSIKILKLIGLRFQKTERKLESLVFKDARTRLIEFIKDIAKERGKKIGSEILVKHRLTHQDIANLTAISRQKVTEILNSLKSEGLIHLERKSFLIRDINKL